MEASNRGIPPPPLPRSMFPVKRSFSTPCDPRDDCDDLADPDLHLSQRLAKTPPLTPKKGGKQLALRIHLLDDTVTIIQAQTKALGRVVFDQICKQLNVLESDYFGLEYVDSYGTKYWLDLEKRLSRQVGLSLGDPVLWFSVKFYTPDPSQLEEEFTRYLFSLQIKRDLATGVLQCNDNTAALMASFIVQAECGDFNEDDYPTAAYLSTFKFVPHQDIEMEKRIRENHRKHVGQSPAEADLHLLETARRTELYGIKMHPGKDDEGVPLNLSVCHLGIVIYQNFTKINTFSWAKIRKLSFKRKKFILKLHPEGYGYYKETVEFNFDTRNDCKSFWKRCVEHHAFFRCEKAPLLGTAGRSKSILTSRGSSFRYSGRTQKQMVAFVRDNFTKRGAGSTSLGGSSSFQRSASFRSAHNVMSSASSGVAGPSGIGGPVGPGHHSGVSTSCSSPAMMSAASAVLPMDDQMDKMYPHMDYPDSPVEIRSQDSQQETISPGTSVTSSPQRYMPVGHMVPHHHHHPHQAHGHHHHGHHHPGGEVMVDQVIGPPAPPVAHPYHPQYPPQGESSAPPPVYCTSTTTVASSSVYTSTPDQEDVDIDVAGIPYQKSLDEDTDSYIGSTSSRLFAGSFGQNEFPVTTVKNVERKLKTLDIPITPLSVSPPRETIRRTRKQRSKSLTGRAEVLVSEDDDEVNFFTIPRRKEKMHANKRRFPCAEAEIILTTCTSTGFRHRAGDETTSHGSYDLLDMSIDRLDDLPTYSRAVEESAPSPYEPVDDDLPSYSNLTTDVSPSVSKRSVSDRAISPLYSNVVVPPPSRLQQRAGSLPPLSTVSIANKRKLTHQKESFYEEMDQDQLLSPKSPTVQPPLPLTIVSPPSPLPPIKQLAVSAGSSATTTPALSPSGKRTPEAGEQQQQQGMPGNKPYKPVLHLKSEEQLVAEAGTWLEGDLGSLTASGSFKRKLMQRQQQESRSRDGSVKRNKNRMKSPDSAPSAGSFPIAPIPPPKDYAKSVDDPYYTVSPEEEEDLTSPPDPNAGRFPIEVHVKVMEQPVIPSPKKVVVKTAKIINDSPNGLNMNAAAEPKFMENKKIFPETKAINGTPKALDSIQPLNQPPAAPLPFTPAYGQIPANELHPLSKSYDLEPVIEDDLSECDVVPEVPLDFQDDETVVPDEDETVTPPSKPARKNPVRKTKSEGAFDTQSKPSALKRSSTEKKPARSHSRDSSNRPDTAVTNGSTPKSSIRFEEVDVPYLLRRRYDLDSVSSNPGSTANFYHHESLSKSKSYGGTSADATMTSNSQLKRLVFCSMTDLPPATNFSWRDDTMDYPTAWDDTTDPFAVPSKSRHQTPQSVLTTNIRKIKSEEIETVAADFVDDISRAANQVVFDLKEVSGGVEPSKEIETIHEERESPEAPPPRDFGSDNEISPECDKAYDNSDEGEAEQVAPLPMDAVEEEDEEPLPSPPAFIPPPPKPAATANPTRPPELPSPGSGGPKPPVPEKPMDLILQRRQQHQLRKQSTGSIDDYPLPPLPEAEADYNGSGCETPRYPPPPPDILQFSYPSRRGSYGSQQRRRSSADLTEQPSSTTESLTTVLENPSASYSLPLESQPPPPPPAHRTRRLHLSRTFSISQEEEDTLSNTTVNSVPNTQLLRRPSITDEANIPPAIPEEPTPTNPLPPPLPPPMTIPHQSSDSFSKQSSSDSLPEPPDPLYDMVESRNSDTVSESHSESPENPPLFLNLAAGVMGFPRTLSRISERTHSSEDTDSTSQFIEKIETGLRKKLEEATRSLSLIDDDLGMPGGTLKNLNNTHGTEDMSGSLNAPLVTITSELADSSATLNDLEEINNEEVDDFPMDDEVVGTVMPVELRSEVVVAKDGAGTCGDTGTEEDDNTFGGGAATQDDTTTTNSNRHRVEVSLTVRDGRIVFEESDQI